MQMVLRLILPVALSFGLLLPGWAPASEDATASEGTASEPSAYTVPVFVPAAESIRVEAVLNSNDPAAMTRLAQRYEHAEGVHYSEIDVDFRASDRSREAILDEIRAKLAQIPGIAVNVGQPIGHRLDHLLSGDLSIRITDPLADEPLAFEPR